MRYSSIKQFDMANGEGIRTSLFVSGCNFHCKECFNPEAWNFEYGELYTEETEQEILKLVANPHIKGLSILGGDPLWQDLNGLKQLSSLVNKVYLQGKSVWIWSGFTWEEIFPSIINKDHVFTEIEIARKTLIANCDIWVDGQFEISKKDLSLKWRGSSNQRVIDIQKSLIANKIILKE